MRRSASAGDVTPRFDQLRVVVDERLCVDGEGVEELGVPDEQRPELLGPLETQPAHLVADLCVEPLPVELVF